MKKLSMGRKLLTTIVCVALLGQVAYGTPAAIVEDDVMAMPIITEEETPKEILVTTVTEQVRQEPSRGFLDRKTAPVANTKATAIIALAKQQIGKPYRYGTAGPGSFDCSGLMTYIFKSQGVRVPRSSSSYTSIGKTVSLANAKPGDIAVFDTVGSNNGAASHVGVLVGNGQIIHAAVGGRGVVYDSLWAPYYAQRLIKIVRVL
ncbi:MAG: C40 family peptidase [Anaerovorax sp.]